MNNNGSAKGDDDELKIITLKGIQGIPNPLVDLGTGRRLGRWCRVQNRVVQGRIDGLRRSSSTGRRGHGSRVAGGDVPQGVHDETSVLHGGCRARRGHGRRNA